ncbi:tol-pal system-associated acyl-CoA thioesterase [Aestuariibacter sp. AA17]|uniref:Tol-pal system-associated acyl-CoA thioesterase n=1 Tax=Fluctibacter corallii TaxID=2984329 RepID=A0ABT3AA47_9ALTE|nr:tol-pal system-associated acyl-CoA thioesterase [Aestuariibacter sp. AA17]MCV2885548.1 tol-pal system-associated acyl-CoA thioesterase [Aestuariibacter sp. AA17]
MSNVVKHTMPVRVYYEDTDAGGIVYYANYLKFLERARTEWLREMGFEQDQLLEQSVGFVVKHVEMDNIRAARFNEILSIHSQIVELKRASVVFFQQINNANNQCLVKATIKVACINFSIMKPCKIPDAILGEMSRVV